jgi:hypothetical protein
MTGWPSGDPKLFAALCESVDRHFPTLHVVVEAGKVFLRGSLAVEGPTPGAVLLRYEIEMEFPADYPRTDPVVRETGGAIPKTTARHFNPDGAACLFLPDARFRSCPRHCTIEEFINGPVRTFFLWQAYYDITGTVPPSGEWKHGVDGIVQFYFEELGTSDLPTVIRFLEFLTAKKARATQVCYCGTGRRLRDCHLAKVKTYRDRIPRLTAQKSLAAVKEFTRKTQAAGPHRDRRTLFFERCKPLTNAP